MKSAAETERLLPADRIGRLGIAGLSMVGIADSLYMLAYDEGLLESIVCPFFGEGCSIVGRSQHAVHFGIPNAAAGVVGYSSMAALALWAGDKPPNRRPWQLLGLAATSLAAFTASIFLTWEQAKKVKAWCFWCLFSAVVNAIIFPVAFWQGVRAFRAVIGRR